MANTTNFNWATPDDTDLVKDGAAAIRTLGSSIDTSFVDLKGGTTGQVLSKASNTDLDYTWVTTNDADAIQNSIVDAKGDLIAASGADTPARLAVGANNTVLTAASGETTGLKWSTANDRYPWSSYTVTTTGVTLGNGTVVGKYQEIGKLVNVKITFTFGSTSSFSLPRFSIPVTAVANSTAQIGFATYVDTGTELYWGICAFENTTTVQAFSTNDTGGNPYRRYIDNTIPFTWASGDLMLLNFSYEAA